MLKGAPCKLGDPDALPESPNRGTPKMDGIGRTQWPMILLALKAEEHKPAPPSQIEVSIFGDKPTILTKIQESTPFVTCEINSMFNPPRPRFFSPGDTGSTPRLDSNRLVARVDGGVMLQQKLRHCKVPVPGPKSRMVQGAKQANPSKNPVRGSIWSSLSLGNGKSEKAARVCFGSFSCEESPASSRSAVWVEQASVQGRISPKPSSLSVGIGITESSDQEFRTKICS